MDRRMGGGIGRYENDWMDGWRNGWMDGGMSG